MNVPTAANVDKQQVVEKTPIKKEKAMDETNCRKSVTSPDDILDDIASTMMIKTKLSSISSNTNKLDEPEKGDIVDENDPPIPPDDENETTAPTDGGKNATVNQPESTNDLDFPSPETIEDDEVRLAMEMAMAAAKNPHLSPYEIQQLVGEKNAQAKMINEFSKQNEEKIKQNQMKNREIQRTATTTTTTGMASSWWTAAAKKAEEMKDRAERSLYAEQISHDPTIIELRKTMKILKKTLKAHRLQGNRVETRHAFKRQRMEKRLMQTTDKLKKTQEVFTNSSYNVQEYIKAMMRASKKWRKIGSDDELLLEAQLSRNMHQMLALEKQKVQCKKNTKEMKKYLQRCKGWLSDKKAFCEMNIMTIDATQNSIMRLYEETLRRQDQLIQKYKSSEEFQNVDLSDVDLSHITIPNVSYIHKKAAIYSSTSSVVSTEQASLHESFSAMRGLPINDSIRKKKGYLDHSYHSENANAVNTDEPRHTAMSRRELLEEYYKNKKIVEQQASSTPELYVVANKDDESVSSRLSDPDASFNNGDTPDRNRDLAEESDHDDDDDDDYAQNEDAPWNSTNRLRYNSTDSSSADNISSAIHAADILTVDDAPEPTKWSLTNYYI